MSTFLFVSYTNFKSGKLTGAHKRFIELVRALSLDNKIIMVSYEIPQLSDCSNIEYHYLNPNRKLKLPAHISGMIAITSKLKKLKKSIKYDYSVAFASVYANCFKNCNYNNIVSLFREDTIEYFKSLNISKAKQKYFSFLERRAINASDKIIVQCENDKKNLVLRNYKRCPNVENKVYVQINNINISWMKQPEKKIQIKDDITRIMFIGDFSNSRKGHSILLPAVARLIDEGLKVELYIAGDGIEETRYKEKYAAYPSIIFLGRIANISEYMAKCDMNVVPSFIDSCPNTILEGIIANVATYGSDTGGIPDLLVDPKYMFKTSKKDVYEFLKKKIVNKEYINDAEGQKKTKERLTFDWGDKIKNLIEL